MKVYASFKQLWLGELPLYEAFWRYAITYDLVVNLACTLIALTFVLYEAPIALTVIFHLLPLPYSIYAATGTWRSADCYQGAPLHAAAAKLVLILWVGFWLVF
jgi:hypothetical protein